MSWEDIPEQDAAISLLKSQLEQGKISHAYLFLGLEGVGKLAAAREFAAAALCENNKYESCGECLSCKKISHANHPDVQKFAPAEDKKELGIDIVRDFQRRLALKPFESSRRFFIIERADRMTVPAANCLLKCLESPPEYAVIILFASEESKLLATVLSRCQKLRFHPLSHEKIVKIFQQHGFKQEAASHLARLSAGSPGKARELIENEEMLPRRKKVFDFLSELTQKGDVNILQAASTWSDWLEDGFPLLDLLMEWFRDIIVFKYSGDCAVRNKDFIDYISRTANNKKPEKLLNLLQKTENTARDIEANVRPGLALQVLLFDLKEILTKDKEEKMNV